MKGDVNRVGTTQSGDGIFAMEEQLVPRIGIPQANA